MLYLLANYRSCFGPLRLFEYVTFRSGCAMITAMLLVIFLGPWTIRKLKQFCVPKSARLEGLVDEKFVDHPVCFVTPFGNCVINLFKTATFGGM